MCQTFVAAQRIFGIISLHYARLFFARRWATSLACQERAMAPFLAMTSRQTFRRPSAQAAATRRACCERQMARTRALNAVFPKAGRPACRSSRSRWRNRFRSQRCRTQGHKEDREDLEERDSTTRQRLAICAHSHSVTKPGLSKTVLQETAR